MINDLSQANAIRSYRELVGNPPAILSAAPSLTSYVDVRGNAGAVPPAPFMWVEVMDGSTSLNPGSIAWSLDGNTVTHSVAKSGDVSTITAQAPMLAAGSVHTNTLIYADSSGALSTNVWTFTVGNYPTIPAEYALASVDTAKPGFKARLRQMAVNRNPSTGNVPNAERQYAGGYNDPATGQPYPNTAGTQWLQTDGTVLGTADADGFFEIPGLINWNEAAPAAVGNFSANSTPPFEDQPVPGLTGNVDENLTPLTDRCVASIETILELKAGPYRLGVNSDDGFRLSAGRGLGDVVGVQLGTAGDRSPVDSFVDFVITADGFYPFRLMWFETSGGASCELFIVDLATGTKTLINDLTGATPVKAYRESAASRPYISRTLPAVNYNYAFADQDLVIDIADGALPVEQGSIELTLNGTVLTPTITHSGRITTVTRSGGLSALLPSGANNVVLSYAFNEGGTLVRATNAWTFNVPAYTRMIPAGNKVLASQVSGAGFRARVHQLDRSKDNNQGNGGRYTGQSGGAANMPRPEIQLAGGYLQLDGQPHANLATPGPNADGSFDVLEVLNFNHSQAAGGPAANAGIFNGDTQSPGLPGTGTSNFGLDNTVHEFTTYLELKAGAHIFGINVDDRSVPIGGGLERPARVTHQGVQHLHRRRPPVDQVLGLSDADSRHLVAKHPPTERTRPHHGAGRQRQSRRHRQR